MKRVANGQAPKEELERFQAIIDQLTLESKRKGTGPSANRLLIDGRTVQYFADEVSAILAIVYQSNPRQSSADLRPPAGSDPLVVLLVKAALDDTTVRDKVRRIADNKPQFTDATDLKHVLDRLKTKVPRELELQRGQAASVAPINAAPRPNGTVPAGQPSSVTPAPNQAHHVSHPPAQQALRSKGPPPIVNKYDYQAVVFEFAGGSGDRYLFPKFSILDFQQAQQVAIASFLIVRKGSASEYGGDPELDYYQPVTIRLSAVGHRHLEALHRVVAPVEEVQRYMNDIMNNTTRAEYVLLAMRLPRRDKDEPDLNGDKDSATVTQSGTPNGELQIRQVQPMQGVLWTTTARATPPHQKPTKKVMDEDEQYQKFIGTVTPKEVEDV